MTTGLHVVSCLAIGALIAFALAGDRLALVWLALVALLVGALLLADAWKAAHR